MKRRLIIGITMILVLVFAVPAFAALSGLTDKQKQEVNNLQKQIIDLRKQMVDKYVEAGQITAEQGKAIKDRVDQAQKYREDNNILPGAGLGKGSCGGGGCRGNCGSGARGGFGGPAAWGGPAGQAVQ